MALNYSEFINTQTANLADNSVTSPKIVDNTIELNDLSLALQALIGGSTLISIINTNTNATFDTLYLANTNSSSITVTLPSAVGNSGKEISIKNIGLNNVIVNTTSSQLIDENLTLILKYKNSFITFVSNGTNYILK